MTPAQRAAIERTHPDANLIEVERESDGALLMLDAIGGWWLLSAAGDWRPVTPRAARTGQ